MAAFDLNLLVIFDTIMAERSVTRAAIRLHLSQPAVSGSLSRLREVFNDELFRREKGNMEPTPRCLKLAEPIRQIVSRIDAFRQFGRSFDPATAIQQFTIAGSDYGSLLFGPTLINLFQTTAPLATLHFAENSTLSLAEQLSSGQAHVAIDATHQGLSDDMRLSYLLMEDLVVIADKFNPVIAASGLEPGDNMPLDLLCSLPHAVRSTRRSDESLLSRLLAAAGRSRTVKVTASQFSSLGLFITGSNLIACVPSLLAFEFAERFPGAIYGLPPELGMQRYSLSLFWHSREDENEAHRWLRKSITDCARQLESYQLARARHWLKAP